MDNEQIAKKLTLILLLKDRSEFTWRWMRYANETKLPFKVIIADGGKDTSIEKLSDPSLYPNVDYEYIRYPYDENTLVFFKKMADSISRVKTPYVVFQACNDDIYFNDGLVEAVKFLDTNPDYATARGDMYNFIVKSPTDQPKELNNIYGELKDFYKLFTNPSNTGASALERFKNFSRDSNTLWLDVCRTEVASKSFQTLCDLKIQDLRFAEYFTNAMIAASGKIHRGSGLFVLHQGHRDTVGLMLTKWDSYDWIESELWAPQFLKLLDTLAKQIASIDGISTEETYNKSLQYYLANSLGRNVVDRQIEKAGKKSPMITKFSHFLSKENPLRKKIKKIYLDIKTRKRDLQNKKFLASSPYREKVEMVSKFLLKK